MSRPPKQKIGTRLKEIFCFLIRENYKEKNIIFLFQGSSRTEINDFAIIYYYSGDIYCNRAICTIDFTAKNSVKKAHLFLCFGRF